MKEFIIKQSTYLEKNDDKSNYFIICCLIIIGLYRTISEAIIPYYFNRISIFEIFLPLLLMLACVLICYACYYVGNIFLKSQVQYLEEECLIDGLLLGILLPLHTPILIILLACLLTVFVGRYFYSEKIIFVPSLIGVIGTIGFSIWLSLCNLETSDSIRLLFEYGEMIGVNLSYVTSNYTVFLSALINKVGTILFIVILLFLCLKRAIKWRITIYFIGSYMLLLLYHYIFYSLPIEVILKNFDFKNMIFLSVFLAPNSRTTPITTSGQILFSISLGILTYYGGQFLNPFLAMVVSILLLNMIVPIFDYFGNFYQLKYCSES